MPPSTISTYLCWGLQSGVSVFFSYRLCLSESSIYLALSLPPLDALMLYSVAYLQTGTLMILALQRHTPSPPRPPTPAPAPSRGPAPLHAEGNKDTRRISVVCLTKWLPETERAMPMGFIATPAQFHSSPPPPPPHMHILTRASLRSALSQGALRMCDRL